MINLKYVRVIQFFLFEAEEIELSDLTGIFGPNAVGKSAFLDAIQIVMMGGNQTYCSFNAQADEKTSRTIRSYCLGQFGQDDQRAREHATTYISLVWEDAETKRFTTTGLCINSSINSDKHEVVGRYIAPGVNILLNDHIQQNESERAPMEWTQFRINLQSKSHLLTGNKDVTFDDSKSFIRGYLHELKGAAGVPSFDAFTRSFKFGIRMKFEKPIDHIIRYDILQDLPTNTGKFKEILDQFNQFKLVIQKVTAKIQAGRKVAQQFDQTLNLHQDLASYDAASKIVKKASGSYYHDLLLESHEKLILALEAAQKARGAAQNSLEQIENRIQLQEQKMTTHEAHKDFGLAESELNAARERKESTLKSIRHLFVQASAVLTNIATESTFAQFKVEIESINKHLKLISIASEIEQLDANDLLVQVSDLAKQINSYMLNGPMRDNGQEITRLKQNIDAVNENINRLGAGKADLRHETISLISELENFGLSPIPVCDLVKVSDPGWQPVIESYLAQNVEALLLPESQEKSAFNIYRQLDQKRNIYHVKVIRSGSYKEFYSQPKVGSVASLIQGENKIALAYLHSQFGDLMCAETDEEALSHSSTLTKDGMLNRRGAYERIKLRKDYELKIGIQTMGKIQQLKASLKEAESKLRELESLHQIYSSFNTQCGAMSGDNLQNTLNNYLATLTESKNRIEINNSILSKMSNVEYLDITKLLRELKEHKIGLKTNLDASNSALIHAGRDLSDSEKEIDTSNHRLEAHTQALLLAEQDPDYDRLKANGYWDFLDNKFDIDYDAMQKYVDDKINSLKRQVANSLMQSTTSFTEFLIANADSPAEEVREDWRKSHQWINAEVSRLENTELANYQDQADRAFLSAQETFCSDVANILAVNFEQLDSHFRRLNKTLDTCPTFSNGERYRFKFSVKPRYKQLHNFIKDVRAYGPQNDLLGGPGELPPEFLEIINDTFVNSSGYQNPLNDYREFYDFDVEIRREHPITKQPNPIGNLSARLGTASGGEHRAPLYVIAGAALASAYRIDGSLSSGLRLAMFDEAFDKMSMNNLVATMRYFEDLGIQVLLASPGENKGALDAFLNSYYDVMRDPSTQTVIFERHEISDETRMFMRQDLPEFNPELIDREIEDIHRQRVKG
jgi:chromosome segregation protein